MRARLCKERSKEKEGSEPVQECQHTERPTMCIEMCTLLALKRFLLQKLTDARTPTPPHSLPLTCVRCSPLAGKKPCGTLWASARDVMFEFTCERRRFAAKRFNVGSRNEVNGSTVTELSRLKFLSWICLMCPLLLA